MRQSYHHSDSFTNALEKAQAGDGHSLNLLLEKWRPYLRSRARRLLGYGVSGRVDSSDLVQEAMTGVHAKIWQFRGHSRREWAGWLKRILFNEASRTRRFHLAERRSIADEAYADLAEVAGNRSSSPECSLLDCERSARVISALEQLPGQMREVVVRRVFEQHSFRDIARDLGRSEGATRVIWTRSIKKLRQLLQAYD